MKVVDVALPGKNYKIYIGKGVLHQAGSFFASVFPPGTKVLVVSDSNTMPLFGPGVEKNLKESGFKPSLFQVPAGEKAKDLAYVTAITAAAIKQGLDRSSVLAALGGGVVGDLTGFCAAAYMRGIDYVQMPTSLMAQVDSSIGGKVAVNHAAGKNLLGFFHQPALVITDPGTLSSLPAREFCAGLMEIIKYGIIRDEAFFSLLEREIETGGHFTAATLEDIICKSCQYKREIVLKDEKETGLRMILNFGHTFGHALEKVTGFNYYSHGEAVGIGMIWASRLAVRKNIFPLQAAGRVEKVVKAVSFPPIPQEVDTAAVMKAIGHDKKKRLDDLSLILPRAIGKVEIVKSISTGLIEETTDAILNAFREK
ncbi:MAG TPA: 3-dehydroquinate synthase [Firmicutes bacterium]|nr:3-dehydroquinate synthase [Bacillota bacterium]